MTQVDGIQVRGRLRAPEVAVCEFSDSVLVRIDDAQNAEFWLELWFDRDKLQELLDRCEDVNRPPDLLGSLESASSSR